MAALYRATERFAGKNLFTREKITYVMPRAVKPFRSEVTATVYLAKRHAVALSGDLAERFRLLKERWQNETQHFSSITQIVLNSAYQQIIGMGPAALPFIFGELLRTPHHWFWALNAITGENPIPAAAVGDLTKMRDAWLAWARERGYIG